MAECIKCGEFTKFNGGLCSKCYAEKQEENTNDNIEKLAAELMKTCAIDAMDALHIAVAIENEAELFITTDDIIINNIINKTNCISTYKITVKNPC